MFDNVTLNITTSISGGSFSHVGAAGSGGMAVFILGRSAGSGNNPPAPSTLTYDGVSMLPIRANAYIAATSFRRLCVYVLSGFNAGTKTIAWTTTYANWVQFGCMLTFHGVESFRDVVVESTGNGVTSRVQTATLNAGEWLIGGCVPSSNWVDGGGQTNRADGWAGDFLASHKSGTGSQSLSWSGSSALVAAGGIVLTEKLALGGATAVAMFYKKYDSFMKRLKKGLIPPNQLEKEYGLVMSSKPQGVYV